MMRTIRRKLYLTAVIGATALAAAGCGVQKQSAGSFAPDSGKEDDKPVKLTVYQRSANISNEEFRMFIAEPVKRKYPHITLELVRTSNENSPQNLIASGGMPDLVFGAPGTMRELRDLEVLEDLTDIVKKASFDLGRFDPAVLDSIRFTGGDPSKLYGIPFSVNFSALYYNKDLFDKFGVAYPKDGLTWEEVTDLAKLLTRNDGGQQYFGLHPQDVDRMAGQIGLSAYDPKTKRASLTGEKWIRVFRTYSAVFEIPGNQPANANANFMKDRNLAMLASMGARLGELEDLHRQGNPLNWDLASYPTLAEAPRTGAETEPHTLMITTSSKHKEAAFKAIQVITGDENQLELTKHGRVTGLKDPRLKEGFGSALQSLKGKNVGAIFYNQPAPNRYHDQFSDIAKKQLAPAMNKVTSGQTDINTALREAEEAANKAIEEELQRQGL